MNDKGAAESFMKKIVMPVSQLCQKYPSVTAGFSSWESAENFLDIEKFLAMKDGLMLIDFGKKLNADEKIQLSIKFYAQLAEMIRKDEI